MEGDVLGTGLYTVPVSYTVPYANHPNYIDRLLDIRETEKCALLFPGLDLELPLLRRNVQRFSRIGTRVIVSSPENVAVANDKFCTFTLLRELGISVPDTVDLASYQPGTALPLAFIVEP
jgi:carbamoyl-phosphate synthase large subunit